ncbi:MAG: multicopper oxidase family protein [Actinomycetes bacterium]
MSLSRRDLLKVGATAGAAAVLPWGRIAYSKDPERMATSRMPAPFTLPFRVPPVLGPSGYSDLACPDGQRRSYPVLDVVQTFGVAEIMPGYRTPVFGYNGSVPGPTVRVQRGQPVLFRQTNLLHVPPPSWPTAPMPSKYTNDPRQRTTSTHLHGSASLPQYDGYASDVTYPGQTKTYFYPNSQEARTLWYHDHAVHHTARNVYNGLAGMYVLHDGQEQALQLPQGRYDVPLVIGDAMFATDGQLLFDDNSDSGLFGDVLLVNGVPWPEMVVERRRYRFRFLNASISRSYEWSLHDGRSTVPMQVIATDGGLMQQPAQVASFRHAMAERFEVVVDFSRFRDDTLLTLRNGSADNNIDYDTTEYAMRFRVRGDATSTENNAVPGERGEVTVHECMTWTEAGLKNQGVRERTFEFIRKHGSWTIDGKTWQDVVDSGYTFCLAKPDAGSIEIWDFRNSSGGWFHPVHVHLVDFQVLSRTDTDDGTSLPVHPYEQGPKDVVYLAENQSVRVAMRFAGPPAGQGWPAPQGRYMMHCHNLVHEDHDMMMQFNVGDPDYAAELDPIGAVRPVDL